MTTIVPVKGVSGKIYRFSMLSKVTELPEVGGIYCFAFPLRYPGAPLESVYLGRALHDLKIEVLQDELREAAIEAGAAMIGYIEVDSRLARRRIYQDLSPVLPDALPVEDFFQEPPARARASHMRR
jgi:hypothetical protein